MDRFIVRPYDKRFAVALLIICALAYLFWTGSRYPSLDEKAMMSGAIQLEDPLSFEARFALANGMSTLERMFWTTLNWIDTNKKGMTFGILFAASFLTLAPYLRRKTFRGGTPNAILGLVLGTPLGVCVNCAAPIARGLYSAGMRAETTLSAMIASPTLNIVVLTMLFSLLPFYMALAKIVLSLLVILVAVPLICRALPQVQIADEELVCPLPAAMPDGPRSEPLAQAILGVVRSFGANLWYIIKMTVPLMLLAGILGAVTATLIPQDQVVLLQFGIGVLVVVAIVGLFLPVPIAFDVVVTGALLAAGLAPGYVMALLFTLGIFSVYSFFIVAQSIGQRAAWLMSVVVVVLGVIAGLGAQSYHQLQSDRALRLLTSTPWGAAMASGGPEVTVQASQLSAPSAAAGTGFVRKDAAVIGIDQPIEFSFRDMWPPFWEGRSLASGDIDRDGDIDLVVASTRVGLYIYDNDGAGRFTVRADDLGFVTELPVFNAVLADVDNDGWQDLILATYLAGNYLVQNRQGQFDMAGALRLPAPPEAILTMSLAVADADRDGDLDIALGQWSAGWYREIPGEESRNHILWNDGGTFDRLTALPGVPGETLSLLFSDIDSSGTADLLVGNDFSIPDYIYLGDGSGGFDMITRASGRIEHTTTTTMAIKSADLRNAGEPELYFAQISGRSSGVSETLKMQSLDRYCDSISDPDHHAVCVQNMQIKAWYRAGNNFDPSFASRCGQLSGQNQDECRAMLVKDLAIQRRDPSICKLIAEDQPIPRAFCDIHFKPVLPPLQADVDLTPPQILSTNVLLSLKDGVWKDVAAARGLEVGGWSWDTKIADFDNDGWQDVYIVNGTWVPNEVSPSNLFFHNMGDGQFVEASGPFGLEDFLMTAAATTFDLDGDGDLDIVTYPVNAPLRVFTNVTQNPGVVFRLRDAVGNRDGIGAILSLEDDFGRTQMREIQLGGGFMSFDAPQVHFGLAGAVGQRLTIRWADGSKAVLRGPFMGGTLYDIHRQ
ncbi:FG-GAP-like repeat-containing protein [Tateyamaria omphalii]|uniref:RNA-binding protein n=1 Tax=Tateyamaria omphalii TaxID=299262 RepID=A0A1P8N1W7_9RHOB|nr:FG-GAP-like repeat-containing protein [Tateyamaria omphalii]APX14305.1 RNA-binding protein [Tateyamaria omphalii]